MSIAVGSLSLSHLLSSLLSLTVRTLSAECVPPSRPMTSCGEECAWASITMSACERKERWKGGGWAALWGSSGTRVRSDELTLFLLVFGRRGVGSYVDRRFGSTLVK